jgi:cytochrome P450
MNDKSLAKHAVTPKRDRFFGLITGHALSLRADRLGFMLESFKQHGDFLIMYLGKTKTILVNDPVGIKHVLFDQAKIYPKNTPGYKRVAAVIGMGVFTDVGEEWRKGRKAIQPIFNPSKFDHYFNVVKRETDKSVVRLTDKVKKSNTINMTEESTRYALYVIGRSLLNEDLEKSFDVISQKLSHMIDLTEKKMTELFPIKTPSKKRDEQAFKDSLKALDDEIAKIIKSEKTKPRNTKGNFIHALLESPENFSDEKILAQVKTMIFAGHETSANVIAWGFYFLAKHPEWQEKIFAESKMNNHLIENMEDLKQFKQTENFVKEVLRVRPPAWSFGRIATTEDKIHAEQIVPGDLISLSPYLIHHHPAYWENPETFNPDRFLREPIPFTYIPYGAGQRVCMGEKLANLEIAMVFLRVVQKFKLELPSPDYILNMNPQVSLRPKETLLLKVTERVAT